MPIPCSVFPMNSFLLSRGWVEELRLPVPKPIFRGIGVLKIFQTILNLLAPPAGERGRGAITNQQLLWTFQKRSSGVGCNIVRGEGHGHSPSRPTGLPKHSNLPSCFLGDEFNFELNYPVQRSWCSSFYDPIWPSPRNGQIKDYLDFKAPSNLPSIKKGSLGMASGMQTTELGSSRREAEAMRAECISALPIMQKMDIPISGSSLRISLSASNPSSFPPSLQWGSSSQAVNSRVIYQRGYYLRS